VSKYKEYDDDFEENAEDEENEENKTEEDETEEYEKAEYPIVQENNSGEVNPYLLHKRKIFIRKCIGFFVAVIFVIAGIAGIKKIYQNKTKFIGAIPTSQITANKNGKSFPINIAQGYDVKTTTFGNNFFVLIGENFNMYNLDGNLVRGQKINYENANIRASGDRILIYEENGNKFGVHSVNKQIFESEISGKILFALLSDENYTAVFYQKDVSMITFLNVYDDMGNNIYNDFYGNIIVNGAFTGESEGLLGVYVKSTAETFSTGRVQFEFENKKKTTMQTDLSIFPYVTQYYDKKLLIAGKNYAAYYKSSGDISHKIEYNEKFLDYSYFRGVLALSLYDEKTLKYYVKILNDDNKVFENVNDNFVLSEDKTFATIELLQKPQKILTKKDRIYILTENKLLVYNYKDSKNNCLAVAKLNEKESTELDEIYDDFYITQYKDKKNEDVKFLYLISERTIEKKIIY
jgi:hypothetical protein